MKSLCAEKKSWLLTFITKISAGLAYIPISAGILAPMAIVLGSVIYFSYFLFGYPLLDWVFYFLFISDSNNTFILNIIGIILLIIGAGLFIYSFIIFVFEKRRSPLGIVSKNIYRYSRHPQNFAIGIMLLPISIFLIDAFSKNYIRVGDVLSWGLSVFFIRLLSIVEEFQMLKVHKDQYWEYMQDTTRWTNLVPAKVSLVIRQPFSEKIGRKYIFLLSMRALLGFGIFLGGMGGVFNSFKDFLVEIRMPNPFFYPQFNGAEYVFESYQYVPIVILGVYLVLLAISQLLKFIVKSPKEHPL